ncbi:hypothetical protein WJX77_008438 [Trebouxia sp. C0004]
MSCVVLLTSLIAAVLASLLLHESPVLAQTSSCTVQSFNVSALAGSFQYAANFTRIGTCASQTIVSLLYLEGDCIEDRDDNSGADCSRQGGTANATSCTDIFAKASSDNFRRVSSIESSSLEFTSGTVCNSNASTAYIFANTTCASFNPSWILAACTNFAPLVTQLNPVEDPDDCRSIKAYNYGAAIGIIVAVIVVLALLIGGWIYWYRRSSRQGVYEPHHDIHMQPYPEGPAGQAYSDQGYSSSSLPAHQTSSTDQMHPGYPASGMGQGGTTVQGTPVYPPWTGGGFQPPGSSTPR